MDKNELLERVRALSHEEWNHYFELPHGVRTRSSHIDSPGYCLNKWARLKPILEALGTKDKTVIDIGCSDGYFCIETSKLGAKHVFGTDIDQFRIDRANLVKEVLNVPNVSFEAISLYDSPADKKYDIALGLGLLHRVPDIEGCIEYLGKIADTLILEFKMYQDSRNMCYVPLVENDKSRGSQSRAANFFYGTPTQSFVETRLKKMGFAYNVFQLDEFSHLNYPRTILISSRNKFEVK
tara:strand:- start:6211 stop:6924 length:714 start_codon:yes stop_codon:yes gene_type:complete